MARILAIDDDPGRYDELRRLLADGPYKVDLEVVTCAKCVSAALQGPVNAILLDYDLDGIAGCASCGQDQCSWLRGDPGAGLKGNDYLYLPTGKWERFVPEGWPIIPERIATILVSANRYGLKAMQLSAKERGFYTVRTISADPVLSGADPELKWLGLLWHWGCL